MNNYIIRLLMISFLMLSLSCSDEDKEENSIQTLAIEFSEGEYKIKKGKAILLTPIVSNGERPIYSWKMDDKIISTELNYKFEGEHVGEYFITFRVDAENGVAEKQIKITVLERLPPKINMPLTFITYIGKDTELKAEALYADEATYTWTLNGAVVSKEKTYIFNQATLGTQSISLKVETEDGSDLETLTITVLPEAIPELFFDNGHYRDENNKNDLRKMTVPIGKTLVLAPVICNIKNPTTFQWAVDGVSQTANNQYLRFTPSTEGDYLITVTEQSTQAKTEVQVSCTKPEGHFFRDSKADSKSTATKAFDFVPAPGQFINYGVETSITKDKALIDLQNTLNGGSASMIGAYGGYWIVGFDHSVKNIQGKADLEIGGNAFAGWSEPGVVWVMQDENGNGLPDDTWYELAGSETGKSKTKQRYVMTYYKPQEIKSDVLWTDNLGNTGSVDYSDYHQQDYYYPMFMGDYYSVTGTRLASTFDSSTGIERAKDLAWGYVDNFNIDPTRPNGHFWIEDAIQMDGSPAKLTHIDFVKVHTGMVAKGTAVGEVSTEAGCPINLNF